MAVLSKKDVRHVANLANLKLTKKEEEKLRKQLSEIVSYVQELNEVDTSNIEPTSQTTGLENVSREDKIKGKECLSQNDALSGTEEVHSGYFKVPGIFEERTDY